MFVWMYIKGMCFERQHYILEIMYLAVRKVKTVIVNVVLKKNAG